MEIIQVDPRDQTWEIASPRYRVHFHTGTASDEFEVSGADVDEVISWAEREQGTRTYVLYACAPVDGLGLVRLLGSDPNAG